jgi:hypothetical protein
MAIPVSITLTMSHGECEYAYDAIVEHIPRTSRGLSLTPYDLSDMLEQCEDKHKGRHYFLL